MKYSDTWNKEQIKTTCIEEHRKDSIQVFKICWCDLSGHYKTIHLWKKFWTFTFCSCEIDKMTKHYFSAFLPLFWLSRFVRIVIAKWQQMSQPILLLYIHCYYSRERGSKMCTWGASTSWDQLSIRRNVFLTKWNPYLVQQRWVLSTFDQKSLSHTVTTKLMLMLQVSPALTRHAS